MPFSIFRVPKTGCFVKQPPKESFTMIPPHFSKLLDHFTWTISEPGYLKTFRPPLVKKTNSCRIGRKPVIFMNEVQAMSHQMIWNFPHMSPHPNNPCTSSLSQIHQAKVRPPSTKHFWTNVTVVKEVLVALVHLSWNLAEYLIWAYHWPTPRFRS